MRILGTFVTILLLSLSLRAQPQQPAGPTQPVILENADTFSGIEDSTRRVQIASGNVRASQGVVKIQADRVVRYIDDNRVELEGNVRVSQPGMIMTAPRADYDGNLRLATAPTGVVIQDGDATIRASSGRYSMLQRVAYFDAGVTLTDKKSTLRAGGGEYHSVEKRATFRDGVRVESDSGTITAQQLTYWRETEETQATGNVVVIPKKREAQLTGNFLLHQPRIGYTLLTGSPKLVDVDTVDQRDSTGALRRDTTVITAVTMESFRSDDREEYVATDSVKLRRGDLQAVSRHARYLPKLEVIALGSGRTRSADTSRPRPDTGATTGTPTSRYTVPPSTVDTAVGPAPPPIVWYQETQLTADTITVGLEEKALRSIDAYGDAFAVSKGKEQERYDQLAGGRLYFDIIEDTIRHIRSEALASSIYFVRDDDEPSGVNRASGDTIHIGFDGGEVSRIKIFGPTTRPEGEYFPEQLVAGKEMVFRLQGFRWSEPPEAVERLNGILPNAPSIPAVSSSGGGGNK